MMKSFMLGGMKYRIDYEKALDGDTVGTANTTLKAIKVRTRYQEDDIPLKSQEQTLCHELVHCILEEIGHTALSENEVFVQAFALMMHQVYATAVYDIKEEREREGDVFEIVNRKYEAPYTRRRVSPNQ